MKFLGILFFFSLKIALGQSNFYFYISGDYYFKGPTFKDDKLTHKDQAWELFRKIRSQAESDQDNNYAIYFDPKGSAYPFTEQHVRFQYFHQGKLVKTFRRFEMSSTGPESFNLFFQNTPDEFNKGTAEHFYYYGIHLPLENGFITDLSNPEESLTVYQLEKSLRDNGKAFDSIFLHVCDNHTWETINTLKPLTDKLILPIGKAPRTPFSNYSFLNSPYLESAYLHQSAIHDFSFESFIIDEINFEELRFLFARLESIVSKTIRQEMRDMLLKTTPDERADLVSLPVIFEYQNEYMVSAWDFLSLSLSISEIEQEVLSLVDNLSKELDYIYFHL